MAGEATHGAPPGPPARRWLSRSTVAEIAWKYWDDRPMESAAALSYYTLLSLAPLVLMAVAVAGLVFERAAVETRVVAEVRGLVGDDGADVVHTVLRATRDRETGVLSVALGLAVLLAGATSVFVQLQSSLNRIWGVEARPGEGAVWAFLRERLLSLAMVLGVGFLLLVSLLLSAALSALAQSAGVDAERAQFLAALNAAASLVVVGGLFAMIFKILPDAPVAWRDVWFGAAATAVLFTVGKAVLGLYLGRAAIGSAYGAAGSVVVLTVWVYYAAMILFLGAEITCVRARHRRDGREPAATPRAVPR